MANIQRWSSVEMWKETILPQGLLNWIYEEWKGGISMSKKIEDYPIEDIFGDEICEGDTYFVFGKDTVLQSNVKQYLIEKQQVQCYEAV